MNKRKMSVLNVQSYPIQYSPWHELGREAHLVMEHPPVHEDTSQRPPLPHPLESLKNKILAAKEIMKF